MDKDESDAKRMIAVPHEIIANDDDSLAATLFSTQQMATFAMRECKFEGPLIYTQHK